MSGRVRSGYRADAGSTRGLVARMWGMVGCVALADSVFGAVFITHLRDAGITAATIGVLLMVPALTSLATEAPSGAFGDRYGHRGLAGMGLLAWAAGLVVYAFASAPVVFGIGIALWAAGLALYSGTVVALVTTSLSVADRADRLPTAVRGAEIARWVGAAAAALLVMVGAARTSTSMLIAISGLLLALLGLWMFRGWPETPVRSTGSVTEGLRTGIRLILGRGERALVAFSVVTSALLAVLILTWQPFVVDELGLEARWLGPALFVLSLGAALGAAVARTTQRVAPRTTMAVLTPLLGLSLAGVALGGPFGASAYVLAEVLVGWALATLATWTQIYLPDGMRATGASVLGTCTGVTIAVTNGVMGTAWEQLGLLPALVLAGLVGAGLATVLGVAVCLRRTGARTANEAGSTSSNGLEQ